ncbi:MAG: 1-acyl-sn-glycerol-3-phosphate acyltransferase [Candidatus Actinomarinales bacterium]|nr:MAG: 1-acyl-sn-glycerol-3-phosphate acyltransferase [Candidatus Actinomarinales bacterium]
MDNKLSLFVVIKTFVLLPLFFIFLGLCCIAIIICTVLPYGKQLATKVYELFAWTGIKIIGLKINLTGENFVNKQQSYVVVSNHPSTIDIFTHIHCLPVSIRFLTKSELYKIPIFGSALRVLGLPKVERGQTMKKEINESVEGVIKNNYSIMVFAEGTRSRSEKEPLPFKKGAAWIAIHYKLAILPVVTRNAGKLMPRGKVWLKSGDVDIEILEPIETAKMSLAEVNKLTERVESLIKSKI